MGLAYLKLDSYLGSDVSATRSSLQASNVCKSHLSNSLLAFKEPSVKGKFPFRPQVRLVEFGYLAQICV